MLAERTSTESMSNLLGSLSSRPEYIISEDLIAGSRPNGKISSVRRFFCLFVTFDLCFTSLLWIICIVISGRDVFAALKEEVFEYSIYTSLFDIVMTSACRFIIILLFYALLLLDHWIIIALSTSGTCAFLVVKVFFFHWDSASQPAFQVILILSSFVLSWVEAWYLDCKVIPQEHQAVDFLNAVSSACPDLERTPLLRSYLQGLPQHDRLSTVSSSNFYSPVPSPQDSDDSDGSPLVKRRIKSTARCLQPLLASESSNYRAKAEDALEAAWDLVHSADWKFEKTVDGITVMSKNISRQVYRAETCISAPPKAILEELIDSSDNSNSWSSNIKFSSIVQVVDDSCDIQYVVMKDALGGLISSRDFVNLRVWTKKGEDHVLALTSVVHTAVPTTKKYVRALNGPSCWILQSDSENENKTHVKWLLNVNLRGWLSRYTIDSALGNAQIDFLATLKCRMQYLESQKGV